MADKTKPGAFQRTITSQPVMKGTEKARDGGRALKDSKAGTKLSETFKRGVDTRPVQKTISGVKLAKEVVTLEAALEDVRKALADLTAVAAVQHAEIRDLQSRVISLEAEKRA